MDRRDFIKTGGLFLGSAAVGLVPSISSADEQAHRTLYFQMPRGFGQYRDLQKNANKPVWYIFLNGSKNPLPMEVVIELDSKRDHHRILHFNTKFNPELYKDPKLNRIPREQWVPELQVTVFPDPPHPKNYGGNLGVQPTSTAIVFNDVWVRESEYKTIISAEGKRLPPGEVVVTTARSRS